MEEARTAGLGLDAVGRFPSTTIISKVPEDSQSATNECLDWSCSPTELVGLEACLMLGSAEVPLPLRSL